ncbi:predicted protein [Nematostella vectensis]|uniref:Tetraspanin n=2 Tax=Nematostella vectensis TaxID=45351 RepID=A7RNN8_NEMVE|nr:predicted protein [Nematostella vectensis]|eukprot:XP_001638950.1 predicted protein [Nematostella vectensis]
MVFFFNLLFLLAGCAIFAIGVWIISSKDEVAGDYSRLTGTINYKTAPILCIVIGIVTVIVAFLACCGALKESQCMLGTYFGLVTAIFCLEVTAIVLAYVYRERIEKNLHGDIRSTMNEYHLSGHDAVTRAIDEIHRDFKCCGNAQYRDWFETKWAKTHPDMVPRSCCKDPSDSKCNENISKDPTKIYRRGCYMFVKKYLSNNLHVISGFGIWIAVIQLMGIIFATCLCCHIRTILSEDYA